MALQLTRRYNRLPVSMQPRLSAESRALSPAAPPAPRLALPDPASYSTPDAPSVEDDAILGAATGERLRRVGPAPLTPQQRYFDIAAKPLEISRGKSGLVGAAMGVQSVGPTDSLGRILGGALGGLGGGLLNKKLYGEQKRKGELAQAAQDANIQMGVEKAERDNAAQDAETQERLAHAEQLRTPKPEKPIYRTVNGVVSRIDPTSGTYYPVSDKDGNMAEPKPTEPKTREILAEDGVSKILVQWNPETRVWDDASTSRGSARTGYVESRATEGPNKGMTTAQVGADADRDAARAQQAAQFRTNAAFRKQTIENLESYRAQQSLKGTGRLGRLGNGGSERATQGLENRFETEKALATSTSADMSPATRARHLANAQAVATTLQRNYGYEAGADASGNPYVKAPSQSQSSANGRGVYYGQSFPRGNLKAAMKMLGVKTPQEAEAIITRNGGRVF